MRKSMIAAGLFTCLGASLKAQACLGAASFSSGPVRISAGLNLGDGAKSYGAGLAVGAPAGAFAAGSVSRTEYDDLDGSGTGVVASVGYALDLTPAKNFQFCPLASFTYEKTPSVETGFGSLDASGHAFGFGGSFGVIVPGSPTFDFIPFAGAEFMAQRSTASLGGTTATDSQNFTNIELGAGFVVNHTLTIRPAVAIPVGIDGAKSTFEIAFSVNFGAGKAAK